MHYCYRAEIIEVGQELTEIPSNMYSPCSWSVTQIGFPFYQVCMRLCESLGDVGFMQHSSKLKL